MNLCDWSSDVCSSDLTSAGRALLTAADAAAQKTALSLAKGDVGLGNVDNTADADKPISTATQTALDGKAATSHTHTSSQISDGGTTGRSLLQAATSAVATALLDVFTTGLKGLVPSPGASPTGTRVLYDNGSWAEPPGAGGGEANTASNVGTAGVGVFKTKTGTDLQFRKINAGSSKITVTLDNVDDEVDIDLGSVAIADVTGLQTALDGKAATSHTHSASQISDSTSAGRALLTAADAAAQKTALSLVKGDVGLGNVDNTSDADKPISTATQTDRKSVV